MKEAYQLGTDAYKQGLMNPYGDAKLAQLMVGVNSLDTRYLTKEWHNGYKEEELNSK